MKCDHVLVVLQQHIDKLLLPIDRAEVHDHLAGCPSCAAEAADLRQVIDGLARLPDAEVDASFTDAVMAGLPEMLPAEQGAGHVARWGVAAAVAVFAFVAGLALLLRGGGPDVAHEALDPLAASLKLGGLMLAHSASLVAALLGAASSALASTGALPKLAFALVFVAVNAALMASVARSRPTALGVASSQASGRR